MSPVRYDLGFYIPENGVLHSHRRENLKLCQLSSVFGNRTFNYPVRFEDFTVVSVTNAVLLDVTPCDSCKNLRFGGTIRPIIRVTRIGALGTTLAVSSNRSTPRPSVILTKLIGPRSRLSTSQKIWWPRDSNPGPLDL
jgi:hypothetical protein